MPFTWNPYEISHPVKVTSGDDVVELESLTPDQLNYDFSKAPQRCLFDLDNVLIDGKGVELFLKAAIEWEREHKQKPQWLLTTLPQMYFLVVRYDNIIGIIGLDHCTDELSKFIEQIDGFDTILYNDDPVSEALYEEPTKIRKVITLEPLETPRVPEYGYEYHIPLLVWNGRGSWVNTNNCSDPQFKRISDLVVQRQTTRILMESIIGEIKSWEPALESIEDQNLLESLRDKLSTAYMVVSNEESDDESDNDEFDDIEVSDDDNEAEDFEDSEDEEGAFDSDASDDD
jgi:hypothetical protein